MVPWPVTAASEFPASWFQFKRPCDVLWRKSHKQQMREGWEEERRDSLQAVIFVSGKIRSRLGLGWGEKLRRGSGGKGLSEEAVVPSSSFLLPSPSPSPSHQGLILRLARQWGCNHWPVVFGRKIKMADDSAPLYWWAAVSYASSHSTFRSVYVRIVFRTAYLMVYHGVYSEPVFHGTAGSSWWHSVLWFRGCTRVREREARIACGERFISLNLKGAFEM